MTFTQKLKSYAQLTSETLSKFLSEHIQQHSPSEDIAEAMAYAVLGGGKRFRPFLVMETAKLFDVEPETSVPVAVALEVVHCYSLVHDDLPAMDNDEMRRGRPTVHIAFDEATAILTGDALLTLGFELLNDPETIQDANVRSELSLNLARAAGWSGMVSGQALDLKAETAQNHSLEDIKQIQTYKTGALITFACEAGAILGGASLEEKIALKTYGNCLGQAFQIADDLLDVEGNPEKMGKSNAKDGKAGKATFVSVLGINGAKTALQDLQTKAIESLAPFGVRAESLIEAAEFVSKREY
ncbi:MAG: polyprenyl synthetase family protein [Pseudomonadota bacterium]